MEPRHCNASQIASLTELRVSSDNDDPVEAQPSKPSELLADSDSDEEYGVKPSKLSKPKRRAPVRRKPAIGPRCPDLLELVLGEMGRKDLFTKNSIKALRLTSRGLKTLVDAFISLSTVTIHDKEGLDELLKSPATIQTMETFRYDGTQGLPLAALMAANPSQLKELVLDTAGLDFDNLVHSSLPNLTYLRLGKVYNTTKALEWLCFAGNAWQLRELELIAWQCSIQHTVLVPALKNLRQLRKLTLSGEMLSSTGPLDIEGFLDDSFPELETLELNINAPGRLGLLNQARLPALLHLNLKYDYHGSDDLSLLSSLDAPWLQQLQSLTFSSGYSRGAFSEGASFLSAFHSGALQTLVIRDWREKDALFESANLQGLTSLKLHMADRVQPRPMASLATATLPLLRELALAGSGCTLDEGDIKFIRFFVQLRSLKIPVLKMKDCDWRWFIINILPRLEEFSTSGKDFVSSIRALDPPVASWPELQKLALEHLNLVEILVLAPRFPSITALEVTRVKREGRGNGPLQGQQTAHEAILNAAVNECAWPELKSLSFFKWGYPNEADAAVLQRAWPGVNLVQH